MNADKHDIALIFPPFAGELPMPPAGVPSLAGYLKSRGHRPYVLDADTAFKKSFVVYKVLLWAQARLLSFRKSKFNISAAQKPQSRYAGKGGIHKEVLRGIGLFALRTIIGLKGHVLTFDPPPLKKVLDFFSEGAPASEMEREIEKRLGSELDRICKMEHIFVAGISVVFPAQLLHSLMIARIIKKKKQDIFIVLGGPQVNMHLRHFLHTKGLLEFIDGFIIYEGELSLSRLIDALKNKTGLRQVPNLYYKCEDGYEAADDVGFIFPIDEYSAPDFTGFDLRDYSQAALPIRTLRGCFWGKCRFCTYPYNNRAFGLSRPEFVIDYIRKTQERCGVDRFEFIDSSVPANFLNRMARLIVENGLHVRWYCRVNFQKEFEDLDFIGLLKRSGCESLYFGVESGSDRIMRLMGKIQPDKGRVEGVIKALRACGIRPVTYFMIGFPTETKAELEETIDFAVMLKSRLNCVIRYIPVFNLLEHSYVFNHPEEFKIRKIGNGYVGHQGYGYEFETSEGLSRSQVRSMHKKALFYIKHPYLYYLFGKGKKWPRS